VVDSTTTETIPEGTEIVEDTLSLDGDSDFVIADSTNSTGTVTAEITQISISAWVMPDYSQGSSEFTVVSSEKSFSMSINNNITPEKVAKFSVFNGISWSSVMGQTQIPEDEWTHLVAVINGDQISLYQNGVLAGSTQLEELVMYTGGIEITPIDQVTGSESGVIVGAYVQTTPGYNVSDQFSGLIESVTTYDSALSSENDTCNSQDTD